MTSADLKDLMLGAAVAVAGYMLYQHFKAKKQAQIDAQLAASVPAEIREWDNPNSPLFGFPPDLANLLNEIMVEGLTMPIPIKGQ
jgi:hypothetical protein